MALTPGGRKLAKLGKSYSKIFDDAIAEIQQDNNQIRGGVAVEKKSDKNYQILLTALLQLKDQIEPSLKKDRRKIGLKKENKQKV